jgi:hypothetical protein
MKKIDEHATKGQATIEIMIILPLLLVLLAVSISIFAQQLLITDSIHSQQGVERSAELVASALSEMASSPENSQMQIVIPSGPDDQTIVVGRGFIEVSSSRGYAAISLPHTEWAFPSFSDGDTLLLRNDENNTLNVQVV